MLHLAWIVPLVLLIFFLASPRYRGDMAESRVRRILSQGLDRRHYTVLNAVVVPSGGGTVEIDHVVISKFGIFVIESQYARGWVSGTEVQDRWKQYHLRQFTRFDNPVHLNRLQAEALGALLHFPERAFHRIVVMVGQKGFREGVPANVLEPEKLIRHMRRKGEHVLDSDQASRALKGIESARIEPRTGLFANRITVLRLLLLLVLAGGLYVTFGDDISKLQQTWSLRSEMKAHPEEFHPDGRRKSEQELWEDSLRCAWSVDTGRCACYQTDGQKAELDFEKCRELAERGSVLKR